ncbi:hypothetical protein [Kalamiella sp. sgz302252]|uniref:hypothetical protein n=1 Tax=Pantoea sp. sgz302252 TaxID=3341827 RepID=UPI0036D3F21F
MKYFLLFLAFFCTCSFAAQVLDNNCKSPISSTSIAMMDEMREKMHINLESIDTGSTKTELLFNEPVSEVLSQYYAERTYEADSSLSVNKYKEIYSKANPVNLIIKFIFKDKEGKEDIFLVSTIANDYECNVEFNGYVIVKREF